MIRKQGQTVTLAKHCPEHGAFESVIWREKPLFADWLRPKTTSRPPACLTERDKGCPYDWRPLPRTPAAYVHRAH